jgi:pentose-5-phosphate-3-epimerase
MKIIPATLRNNFEDIKKDIQSLNNVSDIVSVDICDGEFVPSFT